VAPSQRLCDLSGGGFCLKLFQIWLDQVFWPRVHKTDHCWHYVKSNVKANRSHPGDPQVPPWQVAYFVHFHPELLPECEPKPDTYFSQTCTNKLCVNPHHRQLWLRGEGPEYEKGQELRRARAQKASAFRCKLSEKQALKAIEMRNEGFSISDIAIYMSVERTVIRDLIQGKHYRHLESVNKLRDTLKVDDSPPPKPRRLNRTDRLRIKAKEHRALRERLSVDSDPYD
jgi:hypothetical protein